MQQYIATLMCDMWEKNDDGRQKWRQEATTWKEFKLITFLTTRGGRSEPKLKSRNLALQDPHVFLPAARHHSNTLYDDQDEVCCCCYSPLCRLCHRLCTGTSQYCKKPKYGTFWRVGRGLSQMQLSATTRAVVSHHDIPLSCIGFIHGRR